MRCYYSRREAFLAAVGTFVGALSVGRAASARPCGAAGAESIETEPGAGIGEQDDRDGRLSYSFDRKGRLTSVVVPVDPSAQWSSRF